MKTTVRQPAGLRDADRLTAAVKVAQRRAHAFDDAPGADGWITLRESVGEVRDALANALTGAPATPAFARLRGTVELLTEAMSAMDEPQSLDDINAAITLQSRAFEELSAGLDERSAVHEAYVRAHEPPHRSRAPLATPGRVTETVDDAAPSPTTAPAFDETWDEMTRCAQAVAQAVGVHAVAASDASWFALVTAVDRLQDAIQHLAAHAPADERGDVVRAAVARYSEVAATMRADNGRRLLPGAEAAASSALEQAGAELTRVLAPLRPTQPTEDRPQAPKSAAQGPHRGKRTRSRSRRR